MDSRTYRLLEFEKVLERLAGFAASEAGKAACLAVRPTTERAELAARGRRLAEALRFYAESGYQPAPFPDLDGLLVFVASPGRVLDADGLFAVREALTSAQAAREAVQNFPGLDEDAELTAMAQAVIWPDKTASGLKRCLDADGRLRDEASPDLAHIRAQIRGINQTCTKRVKDFVQKQGIAEYLQDEYMTISSDRYVLPLKTNFKGRLDGIIHDYSQTGETCYFEPLFLVELNNRLAEHKREEREEERRIMAYLTGLIRQELDEVTSAYGFLVQLDVLGAAFGLARAMDGLPLAPGGERMDLLTARHPLLVLAGVPVRPVDIRLEDGQRALIISGGNAGGKTVCLKTLGLVALMAQSGLPVPVAEGSQLPVFDDVFVMLGDEQSLEDAVSTFTAQIKALGRFYPQIDAGTLVILDEFGAGTDPAQGAALAQALLDSLLDRGATIATATHFPALKAYGLTHAHVRSASVMFDPASRKPLFTLAYDQAGASLALDVAREHGFPAEVISRAEQYLLIDGADSSGLMQRLNELAVMRERELDQARKDRMALKRQKERLEQDFAARRDKLLAEVQDRAREIVRAWQQGRVERKQALKELKQVRERLAPESEAAEAETLPAQALEPGASVTYLPWNKPGRITAADERKGTWRVDVGGVSLWAKPEDLAAAPTPGQGAGQAASRLAETSAQTKAREGGGSMTLDIRGRRSDEAVAELERFLDQALLRGVQRVEIVHGRGTGALRSEVHGFLRRYPAVDGFELAPEDQGGDGKTLVELA